MKTFHLPPRLLRSWGQRSHSRETRVSCVVARARAPSHGRSCARGEGDRERGSPFSGQRAPPLSQHLDLQDRARRLGARSERSNAADPYCRVSDWASIKGKVRLMSLSGLSGTGHGARPPHGRCGVLYLLQHTLHVLHLGLRRIARNQIGQQQAVDRQVLYRHVLEVKLGAGLRSVRRQQLTDASYYAVLRGGLER